MRILKIEKPDSPGVTLTAYLPDEVMQGYPPRPCVLILPGGGYRFVSPREGEPVALRFAAEGFHACVLQYSVSEDSVFPTALCDVLWAMAVIRSHSLEWHLDPAKIAVCGFSAGGHLAACLGAFWKRGTYLNLAGVTEDLAKPNALILCYPVITSGVYAHTGSFEALLGKNYGNPGQMEALSLEKQVTHDMPPCFLWHTADDGTVPVQNTLLFASALSAHRVPYELRIFESGSHGLSLGITCTSLQDHPARMWFSLAADWLKRKFAC